MKKSLNLLSAMTFALLLTAAGALPAVAMHEYQDDQGGSSSASISGAHVALEAPRHTLHVQGDDVPEDSDMVNTLILSNPSALTGALVQEHAALATVDTVDVRLQDVRLQGDWSALPPLRFLQDAIFAEGVQELRVALPLTVAGLHMPFMPEALGTLPNLRALHIHLWSKSPSAWRDHVMGILRQLQVPAEGAEDAGRHFQNVTFRFPALEQVHFSVTIPHDADAPQDAIPNEEFVPFFVSFPALRQVSYGQTQQVVGSLRDWVPTYTVGLGDQTDVTREMALESRAFEPGEAALELMNVDQNAVQLARVHWAEQRPTPAQAAKYEVVRAMLDVLGEYVGLLSRQRAEGQALPMVPQRTLAFAATVIPAPVAPAAALPVIAELQDDVVHEIGDDA